MKTEMKAFCAVPLATLLLQSLPALAEDSLADAVKNGKSHAQFRLRYEESDDSVNRDAEAVTLRSRIGYETADYKGFRVLVEVEDVAIVGADDYAPETGGYAAIADPDETELNRAQITYTGIENLTLTAGRQRMNFDNQRFIGAVGWRQDEQTFTALRADYSFGDEVTVSYAFQDRVFGIMRRLDHDVRNHLLNISWSGAPLGKLVGYGYFLEDEDAAFASNDKDNDTVGLRYEGGSQGEALGLNWKLEYADQKAGSFDARYSLIEGGVDFKGVGVKAGQETLGSDGGAYGFRTPYATMHAFNGWADKFLATPGTGLKDRYMSVGGKVKGTKLLAVYHDFDADSGSANYGHEWNLLAVRKFGEHYAAGLKYANYDAGDFSADTDKLWFWVEANF